MRPEDVSEDLSKHFSELFSELSTAILMVHAREKHAYRIICERLRTDYGRSFLRKDMSVRLEETSVLCQSIFQNFSRRLLEEISMLWNVHYLLQKTPNRLRRKLLTEHLSEHFSKHSLRLFSELFSGRSWRNVLSCLGASCLRACCAYMFA